jgi:hypothetical protein
MFGAGASLWGCRSIKNKQTIAIAVKYPMRSAAIVISIPPLGVMLQEQEKSCALRHTRLGKKWNYSRPLTESAAARLAFTLLSTTFVVEDYHVKSIAYQITPMNWYHHRWYRHHRHCWRGRYGHVHCRW